MANRARVAGATVARAAGRQLGVRRARRAAQAAGARGGEGQPGARAGVDRRRLPAVEQRHHRVEVVEGEIA